MISPMATPVSGAPGSVGVVDTQFLDLPAPIKLDCGRSLSPIRVAYETYGTLARDRDNVILVCHALSGDAHAAGIARTPPAAMNVALVSGLARRSPVMRIPPLIV